MSNSHILVVGAGFAGAVTARQLADAGHRVTVIDKRDHIAGNAFDYLNDDRIRIHKYGPHLFHTNNQTVIRWLKGFAEWVPYHHRARAKTPNGGYVPIPINRVTISKVHGVELSSEQESRQFLASVCVPSESPRNAAEFLLSRIGQELTDLFYRPYSRKMWNLDLEQLDVSVVRRLPIRHDTEDRYFSDAAFQALPRDGYTQLFANMLDHPAIDVQLNTAFQSGIERDFSYCFNSMPIDEFFDFRYGELPYRSIKFHHGTHDTVEAQDWAVTNFTDDSPYTRETHWHVLPGHSRHSERYITTLEEPCDYKQNAMERYYPVKTSCDSTSKIYEKYARLARGLPNMTFVGRCGTYRYLDMDQVINQSLVRVAKWLSRRSHDPRNVQFFGNRVDERS